MKHPLLISTAPYDGYDFATALREIAGLGVDMVEIAFIEGYTDPFTEDYFNTKNANRLSTLLKKNNLECLSFSSHIDLAQKNAVRIFTKRMEFAKKLGSSYIISNAGPTHQKERFMENIHTLGLRAVDMGLMIVLENPGDGRDNVLDSAKPAAKIVKEIGMDSVKLNYDFGNLLSHCFEKLRPEQDYKHALDAIAHFHVKDVASTESGWHFTEIGKGTIKYANVLKELAALSEPVPISLEIPLRVTRAPDASPRRAPAPIELKTIRQILSGSVKFVKEKMSA